MYVKPFGYERAGDIGEALELLRAHGPGARILAGGQSLLPMLNLGLYEPDILIDIGSIPRLSDIEVSGDALVIGAMTRHRSVELDDTVRSRQPLLADAIGHVGNTRVRNIGTVGGSIVHNDPAAELPLVMVVLDANYELTDGVSRRKVKAEDFGVGSFETSIREGEVLTAVEVPTLASEWCWGFREFSYRPGDFAVAAAAVIARFEGNELAEVHVGITGVGGGPVRCASFEEAATGRSVDQLGEIESLVTTEVDYVMEGLESSEYRAHIAGVVTTRAIVDAFERSREDNRS